MPLDWPVVAQATGGIMVAATLNTERRIFQNPVWYERLLGEGLAVPSYPAVGYSGFLVFGLIATSIWVAVAHTGWVTVAIVVAGIVLAFIPAAALGPVTLKAPRTKFRLLCALALCWTIANVSTVI